MVLAGNIWINIGCFILGLLIGSLILMAALKSARNQMEDLEEEEAGEEEQKQEN